MDEKIFYEKHSDEKNYVYFRMDMESAEDFYYVEPHFHNAVEIKLVLKGGCLVNVGNVRKEVSEGALIFVNSRQIHSYYIEGFLHCCTLVFDSRFLHNVCGLSRVFKNFMDKNEQALAILKDMTQSIEQDWKNMSKENKIGFIYRFIGTILQYYGSVEEPVDKSENIAIKIIQYIQSNYTEDLTLDFLSEKFGYTRTYFSYLFNRYVGMSLRDYLNRRRVEAAMQMMADDPRLPLSRVAEKVGYKSWVTFYRAYKKYGTDFSKNNFNERM